MLAYRELPDADLFTEEWVAVPIHPREMPGYKSARIACELAAKASTTTAKFITRDKIPLRSLRLPGDPLLPAALARRTRH